MAPRDDALTLLERLRYQPVTPDDLPAFSG